MFEQGNHVVCKNSGVCLVDGITTLNMNGIDKDKKYYILKPIYIRSSTIYIPVDNANATMRRMLSKEEALALISSIPKISFMQIGNEKTLEVNYKKCLMQNNCTELVKLIKTIYIRKTKRVSDGRKITATDSKYLKLAETCLFGELSMALDISKEEAADCFKNQL